MKTWDEVVEGYRERWIKIFSQGVEGFSEQACREIVYALTPKTGKWIDQDHGAFFPYECSVCHRPPTCDESSYLLTYYCPHCGARMRGAQNET